MLLVRCMLLRRQFSVVIFVVGAFIWSCVIDISRLVLCDAFVKRGTIDNVEQRTP